MQMPPVNCKSNRSRTFFDGGDTCFRLFSLLHAVLSGKVCGMRTVSKRRQNKWFQWFLVIFVCFSTFFGFSSLFATPPSTKSCKTTEKKQVTSSVHARGRSPKISEFFMKNVKILVLNFRLFLAFLHGKSLGSEYTAWTIYCRKAA